MGGKTMQVSDKLRAAIYLSQKRAYQIAQEAGLHPCVLSKLLNGIEIPKPADPRVIRVGQIVGVSPNECFADGEALKAAMGS